MLNNIINNIEKLNTAPKKVIIRNHEKHARTNGRYITWRRAVYKRDNYTCKVCRRRNVRLNAHHIRGFSRFKTLRYKLENGITLCSSCHWKFHRKYGKSNFPSIKILINEGKLEL